MTIDINIVVGPQFLFNNLGTYSPATLNDLEATPGTTVDVAFDLTSVAAAAAEASAKADLGASRAPEFMVQAAIEMAVAPVTGTTLDFYWAPSALAASGAGNPGFVHGNSAVFTGTPATLAEALKQLTFIGSMPMTADATGVIQMADIGVLRPTMRYGCLVVINNTAQATHDDVIEQAVSFTPIIPQAQDAV